MSAAINPEAGIPMTTLNYEQSDRNPQVVYVGGTDRLGGVIPAPASSESRVTQGGAAVSPDAGLQNYDSGDVVDSVQDEAEREG